MNRLALLNHKAYLSTATANAERGAEVRFFLMGTAVMFCCYGAAKRGWIWGMNIRTGHQDQCYKIQDEYAAELLHVANITLLEGFCWITVISISGMLPWQNFRVYLEGWWVGQGRSKKCRLSRQNWTPYYPVMINEAPSIQRSLYVKGILLDGFSQKLPPSGIGQKQAACHRNRTARNVFCIT